MKNLVVDKIITLGSLFDGIGGFVYAASLYGVKTLWASEIIPAAISVTLRHFPDMEHVGDITKLRGGELTPVHIITFGSPCQSFSIAGGRKGLEGKSGLFWEAIRIIREMREATNGQYPRYCVFENVPGILSSSRGRDYKTVLEAFTETKIPMPPSGKWTNAGMVRGGRTDLAWVIHDAQYFGVAQRRRRLFAVCDFTGQRAAEILFKPKSLYWYFTQSGEARKGAAPNAQGSVGATGGSGKQDVGFDGYNGNITGSFASTLGVNCGVSTGRNGVLQQGKVVNAPAVTVINDQGGDSLTIEKTELSPTLRSEAHGNLPIVSIQETYPINTQIATRHKTLGKGTGFGIGENGDPAYTLQEAHSHAVAVGINGNVAGTLDASYYKGVGERCGVEREIVLCAATGQSNAEILNNLSATLNCNCEQPIICLPDTPAITMRIRAGCEGGGKGALLQNNKSGTLATGNDQILFCAATTQVNAEICDDLCPTITEAAGKSGNNKPYIALGVNQNAEGSVRTAETAYSLTTSSNASSRNAPLICHPEITGTLCASGAGLSRPAGMANETDLCVVVPDSEPIPIQDKATRYTGGGDKRRDDGAGNGLGVGKSGDPVPTITSRDRHAVAAYCLQGNMIGREDKNGPQGGGVNEDVSFTLNTTDKHAVAAVDCRNLRETEEISGTLQAKESGSYSLNYQNPVRKGYIVRRLTPTECERLQGYGDGWTEHGHDGKPLSDTARYQALGNSVAIPCVAYVISGIVDELLIEMED